MPDKNKPLDPFTIPIGSVDTGTAIKQHQVESDLDKDLLPGLNQEQVRARNQGFASELGNGIMKAALKIPGNVVSNLAAAADIEDYYNQDTEIGNWITNTIQDKINPAIDDAFAVYRENPNKALDLGDSAWWVDNGTSLAGSATEFAITGSLISGVTSPLLALGPVGAAASKVLTAAALNQAEAITSARDVYKNAYELHKSKGKTEEEAKQIAADAAAYTININRLNLPLNLSSANLFTKTPAGTRALIKDAARMQGIKRLGAEGAQEAGEEIINHIGQQEGERRGKGESYSVGNTIRDIFSAEGIEAGLLGAAGGAAQTGATEVVNSFNGINKDHNERYAAQQARLAELEELRTSVTGGERLEKIIDNVTVQANLQNKIYEAEANHNDGEAQNLKNQLLQYQALNSFTTGTTEKLIQTFESLKTRQGATGESIAKANEAIEKIKKWEDLYNEQIPYETAKEKIPHLFNNKVEKDNISKQTAQNNNEIMLLQADIDSKKHNGIPTLQEEDKMKILRAKEASLKVDVVANAADYNQIRSEDFNAAEYSKKKLKELRGDVDEEVSTEEEVTPKPKVEKTLKVEKTEPTELDEEAEYEEFKKTGKASEETLNRVANKYITGEPLTDIEKEYAKSEGQEAFQKRVDTITGNEEPELEPEEDSIESLNNKRFTRPFGEYIGKYKIQNGKVVHAGVQRKDGSSIASKEERDKANAEAKKLVPELSKLDYNQLKNLTEGKEAGEGKKVEKKETKAPVKPPVVKKTTTGGQPPIKPPVKSTVVADTNDSIQGAYTLAKTAATKVQDISKDKPSNLRWQNWIDSLDSSKIKPETLAFKVVTSNDGEEYYRLLDPKEKEEIAAALKKDPKRVFVQYLLVDKESHTPILAEDGNFLTTVPLKNETIQYGPDKGKPAISPKHFLASKGKKNPELGEKHPEWNTLWAEEVAKKDAFRKALESGQIGYVNIVSVSPGHIITEESGKQIPYISPSKALWNKEDEADAKGGVIGDVKLFIPTTPAREGKELQNYQLVDEFTDKDDITGELPFRALKDQKKKLELGHLYAFVNGSFFKLKGRKLLPFEVTTVANLFAGLSTDKKPKNRLHVIDNYIHLSKTNEVSEDSIFYEDGIVYFGDSQIRVEDIGIESEEDTAFREFLANRYRQVDTQLLKSNKQVPYVNERGVISTDKAKMPTYYDFIFGDEAGKLTPAFTIQMKPKSEKQRENRYMIVDDSKPANKAFAEPVKKEEEIKGEPTVEDVTTPLITEEVKGKAEPSGEELDFDIDEFEAKDESFRLALGKKNYTKENIAAAKTWYNKQFGDTDIEITKRLIDGKAFGQFYKNVLRLWENAEEGTVFHEAEHKVEKQYLTEKEVKNLDKELRSLKGNATLLDGTVKPFSELTDKEASEYRAEDFRNYMLSGQKTIAGQPVRNTMFRKLWRMIKAFVTGKKDIQSVFEKLAGEGYSKDKKVRSFDSKLNRPFKDLSETETMEFNNRTTFMMFDALFTGGKTPIELKEAKNGKKLLDTAYNITFNRYREAYRQAVTDKNADLAEQLHLILKNWNEYVEQHKDTINNLIQVKDGAVTVETEQTLEELEDEAKGLDVEEEKGDSRGEHQAVNEVNPIVMSANNTRILLATLAEKTKDKNGNIVDVIDEAGFRQPAKFNEMYKLLINELKGLESTVDMYVKLKSLVDIYPTIQSLLDRLGHPADVENSNFNTGRVWTDFWQDMNNFESTGVLTMIDENGKIYQVEANRHNLEGRIKDDWRAKLKLSDYADNSGAELTLDESILDMPAGSEDELERVQQDIAFFEALGVEFDGYTDEELATRKHSDGSINTEYLEPKYRTNIEKHIKEMLKEGKPVNDLTKIGSATDVNALTDIIAKRSKLVIEHSFQNAEDKRIHTIQKNNFFSKRVNAINNAASYQELVAKYPEFASVNMQGSVWLREIFGKKDGTLGTRNGRIRMVLNTVAGIKSLSDDNASIITEAGTDAKFIQEIENLFSTGMVAIPRSADGTLEQTGGVYKGSNPLVVDLVEISKQGFEGKSTKKVFKEYFLAELERIRKFNINKLGQDVDIYNKNANKWTIFEDILSAKTKKELEAYMSNTDTIPTALMNKVLKDVATFFENESVSMPNAKGKSMSKYPFGSTLEQMHNTGLIRKGKAVGIDKDLAKANSIEDIARAYTINHFIQTVEHHKIFLGDKAFFKDIFKRTKGGSGTKKYCNNDESINKWINNPLMKKFNSALEYTVGKTYKALVVNDVKATSDLMPEYINALAKENEEEALSILEAYNVKKGEGAMDEADAQCLSNLVFHRHMMLKASKWGIKQEEKYDYEMAYMFIKLHERAIEENSAEKYGRDLSKYILDEATLAKYKEATKVIPEGIINIQKGQYFGPQNYKGLNATTFHKYSIAPMYWRLVEGTNLEDKYLDMLENKVGYMVFHSGVKVGARLNKNNKMSSFYNADGSATSITGDNNDSIQELPFDYLGIQVELEAKAKKDNTFGTQFRKLFESNLFDAGRMQVAGFEELHKEYVGLIKALSEKEWNGLMTELEVELKPDGSFKDMNVAKLVEVLQAEGKSRQLADNLVDSLQIDKNGKLKYPIDSLVNRVKLENLMVSLVNSRVVRQKMPGTAAVQLATTGLEKKGKRKVGGSNDLKSYRKENPKDKNSKTLPMQVKVPLHADSQFKDLLKKYGSLEAVNKAIKEPGFDKRLITMVGYRIPTQGLNSIEFMEVVEFLPDTHGDAIILPTEIVAKSGGDFDIDKLNIFRPNFTTYTKSIPLTKAEYVSKALGIPYTEEQVEELLGEGTKDIVALVDAYEKENYNGANVEFKYATGNSKQAMQNRIIEISKTILESPYMFEQLITPNTTRDMDAIVSQVRYAEYVAKTENPVSFKEFVDNVEKKTPSTTQELMFGHILNQFEYFLGGKSSVGTDAVNITAHVLFQQAGIYLNKTKFKLNAKTLNEEEVENVRLNIEARDSKNHIDMGAIYNMNNKMISDIQSQIANLHLDAAKDPKYKDINLTKELLPTIHFLLHTGASEDTIIYLMKQPVILDLILFEKESILDGVTGKQKLNKKEKEKRFVAKFKKDIGWKKDKNYVDKVFSYKDNADLLAYIAGKKEADVQLQVQMLEDFIRYRKYAGDLTSFSKLVNYDTNKFKDLAAIDERIKGVSKLASGKTIFQYSDYVDILNKTIVGAFNKTAQTQAIFSPLFTTESEEFKEVRDRIIGDVNPQGKTREKLPTMINNDFINYLTQRFGEVDGVNVADQIYDLFFDEANNLARRLIDIKKKVGKNVLLDEMQAILSKTETEPNNITMYSRKLQKHEADTLTGAFRELLDYQDKDVEKMEEVQKFAKDLVTFGILQSGLHNSPITFLGQIPFDSYGDITKAAIDKYESLSPEQREVVLNDFEYRFYLKNIGNNEIVPIINDEDEGTPAKFSRRYNRDDKTSNLVVNGKKTPFNHIPSYGYKLQEFFLGYGEQFEGDLSTGSSPTPSSDDSSIQSSPEAIEKVRELLESGMSVEDILLQNIHQGLSEDELNRLADELSSEETEEGMTMKEAQEEITKRLAEVINESARKHLPKEQVKSRIATGYIGEGSKGSSTDNYMKLYDEYGLANTGEYDSSDVIWVSSNGARGGRVNPIVNGKLQGVYKNIDKAIEAGATIVMDTADHIARTSKYNIGEVALAEYMVSKGYTREGKSGIWKPLTKDSDSELDGKDTMNGRIKNDIC